MKFSKSQKFFPWPKGLPRHAIQFGDWLVDNEGLPSTPASSKSIWFNDSTTKKLGQLDDSGKVHGILSRSFSTSAQGALATSEVYLTGSGLLIPSFGMQAGMLFVWYMSVVKTGAGVAAPIWTFRIGAAQTTGDTSRLALTATGIQVATAFDGILMAAVHVQSVSASGVIIGSGGSGPDFGGGGTGASAGFDNTATIAGQYIGLTVTTGTSAAWTVNAVSGFLMA